MLKKCRLVFLGPPGAGKGTIAKIISEKTDIVHISTGDILRNAIRKNTQLGIKARSFVEAGNLVPDDIVADMVGKRLLANDCIHGFILDGFPRTLPQAEMMKIKLEKLKVSLDIVIFFDTDRELILKRLSSRIVCRGCGATYNKLYMPPKVEGVCDECGGELYQRKDDSPETAEERLAVYEVQTAPLIKFYENENLLLKIDSNGDRNSIVKNLMKELD